MGKKILLIICKRYHIQKDMYIHIFLGTNFLSLGFARRKS